MRLQSKSSFSEIHQREGNQIQCLSITAHPCVSKNAYGAWYQVAALGNDLITLN